MIEIIIYFLIGAIISGLIMRREDVASAASDDNSFAITRVVSLILWPIAILWVLSVYVEKFRKTSKIGDEDDRKV